MKKYIISKQFYDAFYVYGVFSKEYLPGALRKLAKEPKHKDEATRQLEQSKSWYNGWHLKTYDCEYGCEHMPKYLDMSLLDISMSLFTITEIEEDKVYLDGEWVG